MSNIRPVSQEVAAEVFLLWLGTRPATAPTVRLTPPPATLTTRRRIRVMQEPTEASVPPQPAAEVRKSGVRRTQERPDAATLRKMVALKAYGLTYEDLSERYGYTPRAIENWLYRMRKGRL